MYRTVIFDCDSTLSAIEGIDELVAAHRPAVAALTEAAMRGEIPLEQVYARRLDIIRPRREQVEALGQRYVASVVSDGYEVLSVLRAAKIDVRVISGGLLPAVLALTRMLGVSDAAVSAVDVYFSEDGSFAGFDTTSPLARSGGKGELVKSWASGLRQPAMMVGDGVTDLEVIPYVQQFVAFAGFAEREKVIAAADVVIRERSLAPVVPIAFGDRVPAAPAARKLFEKGLMMIERKSR